ncbi:MAG: hypothetical protein V3V14_11355 [Saprospiraceae bacterium]
MKKLLILCLVAISTVTYSQKEIAWFDTGIKIMYGSSYIVNNAAIDHDKLGYDLSFGSSFGIGGKFGINKGYNGLAIELLYSQNSQEYEYLNSNITPQIDWNSLDLYLLFRNAKNLGFFEIGPKFGFLKGVERTGADGEISTFENFNKKQLSAVLGFGVNVIGTDGSFSGQIGLRFEYGFSDLNGEESGSVEPYPFDSSVYANGYEKSIPVYAGLVFELNWGLGFYGIAKCGARAKFFSL